MGLTLTKAFEHFGAQPRNIRSSVSAFTPDGALVISLWQHYFSRSDSGPMYVDRLSRWAGSVGNTWLREDLEKAWEAGSPIRAIIVSAKNHSVVDAGEDASKIQKEFHIPRWKSGSLVRFDGDEFAIQFPTTMGR